MGLGPQGHSGPSPPGTERRPSSGSHWGCGEGDGEAWPPSPSVASLPDPDVHFNLTIPEDPGETGGWPVLAVSRRARALALPVPLPPPHSRVRAAPDLRPGHEGVPVAR